jgi:hypothetical protein
MAEQFPAPRLPVNEAPRGYLFEAAQVITKKHREVPLTNGVQSRHDWDFCSEKFEKKFQKNCRPYSFDRMEWIFMMPAQDLQV